MGYLPISIRKVSGGFIVIELKGLILSIFGPFSESVRFGDKVVSSGKFAQSFGAVGIVVKIFEPYKNGRTSNVIRVRWLDGSFTCMKMDELLLPESAHRIFLSSN